MVGRVLSKVGGRAILLLLNILDSARIRLYMMLANMSRGIGQRKGVMEVLLEKTSGYLSGCFFRVNSHCQLIYTDCKDVNTDFQS